MRSTVVLVLLFAALMLSVPAAAETLQAGTTTIDEEVSTAEVTCANEATCDSPSVEARAEAGGGNVAVELPDEACADKVQQDKDADTLSEEQCEPTQPSVDTGVLRLYVDVDGLDGTGVDSSEDQEAQANAAYESSTQDMDYAMMATLAAGAIGLSATGAVAVIGLRRFMTILLGPLAARLETSELLEDETRQAIYETVKEDPGINLRALAEELDLAWGTLLHHLHKLEKAHMIVTKRYGKYRRCFLNGSTYSKDEKARLAALSTPSTARVAEYVLENPGSTQSEIGEALGVTPSTVLWHAKRLMDVELIETERDGRYVKYYPQLKQHEKTQLASA